MIYKIVKIYRDVCETTIFMYETHYLGFGKFEASEALQTHCQEASATRAQAWEAPPLKLLFS